MDCPFCNKPLKKIPGRKTKCPHCSEFIYVRTDPTTKEQVFVNEKRAMEINEEWSRTISSYDIIKYLHGVGIDEKAFIEKKKALFELYKTPIMDSNIASIMLSELSISAFKRNDYQRLRMINSTLALIEHHEKRPFFHLLVEARKFELLELYDSQLKTGCDEIKIFAPVGECDNCMKLDGKIFKMIDALETMPLPNPYCTNQKEETGSSHGWCICSYNLIIDIQKFQKFLNEKYNQ